MKKLTFAIILLALTLSACSGSANPTATATPATTAAAGSTSGIVTAEGKLLPAPAVELAFAQGGVVSEVLVKPGDKVRAGDVLARLIGIKAVQADLAAAQAQYDQIYSTAMAQETANRTKDWYKTQAKEYTLPLWYYDQKEQMSAAQAAVETAQTALTKAQKMLDKLIQTTGADFVKAESELARAQADYRVAKNLNDRIKNSKKMDDMTRRQLYLLQRDAYLKNKGVEPRWVLDNNVNQDQRDEAQKIFDNMKSTLKDAQEAYDDAVTSDDAKDVLKARAQASIAQERYYTALDYVRVLQTGAEAQTVTAASTSLDKAKAALEMYELRAPFDGTILSFDLSAGESVVPSVPVAFLADTTTWTVETKDLAEIDIAQVSLGQNVSIKLDALPGEEFSAKVTTIDPVGQEKSGDMTYKVTVTLDKVDPRFKWNMTATVKINIIGE